jgi:hypothetical protein
MGSGGDGALGLRLFRLGREGQEGELGVGAELAFELFLAERPFLEIDFSLEEMVEVVEAGVMDAFSGARSGLESG